MSGDVSGKSLKHDFDSYIRRYLALNGNSEYGYNLSKVLFHFLLFEAKLRMNFQFNQDRKIVNCQDSL